MLYVFANKTAHINAVKALMLNNNIAAGKLASMQGNYPMYIVGITVPKPYAKVQFAAPSAILNKWLAPSATCGAQSQLLNLWASTLRLPYGQHTCGVRYLVQCTPPVPYNVGA